MMRNINKLPITLCLLGLSISLKSQEIPVEGIQSITPDEMKAHVYYLASDEMQGRNTPSHELDTCAVYIAEHFASYGIKPICPDQSFFQSFFLRNVKLSKPNTFHLKTEEAEFHFRLKDDFVPLHMTANRKISTPIVFAGYGITAPEYSYDDYGQIDVRDKIVLIFNNEPQERDTSSIFKGDKDTFHSKIWIKIDNAIRHGAVGLILVSNPLYRFRRPPNTWPSLMRNPLTEAKSQVLDLSTGKKIVCVQIGQQLAGTLLSTTGFTLNFLHKKIDRTLQPQSFEINDKTAVIETQLKVKEYRTQNVIGVWEGTDFKDEFLIIGAHYDHVGVVREKIYNGADDNASGTGGILEIAQAFSECKVLPKRSIIFIAFSGEEKGLFGSRYYIANPALPLEKTIAMLNLDMISRNDTNEVAIIGTLTSADLKLSNELANQKIGMKLVYDQDEFLMLSDHYPFYREDIPTLFFHSKITPDYHRPTDDPEKTIPEKMALISQLVFSTAWIVANKNHKPNFTQWKYRDQSTTTTRGGGLNRIPEKCNDEPLFY